MVGIETDRNASEGQAGCPPHNTPDAIVEQASSLLWCGVETVVRSLRVMDW